LVEKYEGRNAQENRRDDQVWHDYAKLFANYKIVDYLETKELGTTQYSYTFAHAYKNEKWHPVEPVSLDMANASYILEKANKWIGRVAMLADSKEIGTLYLLLGAPKRPDLLLAYDNAAHNLETKSSLPVKVIREENSQAFAQEFAAFIASHQEVIAKS